MPKTTKKTYGIPVVQNRGKATWWRYRAYKHIGNFFPNYCKTCDRIYPKLDVSKKWKLHEKSCHVESTGGRRIKTRNLIILRSQACSEAADLGPYSFLHSVHSFPSLHVRQPVAHPETHAHNITEPIWESRVTGAMKKLTYRARNVDNSFTLLGWNRQRANIPPFSKRELKFTFAICYRPSVCLLSVVYRL